MQGLRIGSCVSVGFMSFSLKTGLRFSAKASMPSFQSLVVPTNIMPSSSAVSAASSVPSAAMLSCSWPVASKWRLAGERGRTRGRVQKALVIEDAVGEADAHRLFAVDAFTQEDQFARLGQPTGRGSSRVTPPPRKLPMLISGRPICALLAISTKSEASATSAPALQREAIHRGDDGFLEEHQSLADDLFALQILAPVEGGAAGFVFLEVGTDAKGAAFAGEQHYAGVLVGFGTAQCVVEFVIQGLGDGIEAVRPVEADFRDAVAHVVKDCFVAHRRSFAWRGREWTGRTRSRLEAGPRVDEMLLACVGSPTVATSAGRSSVAIEVGGRVSLADWRRFGFCLRERERGAPAACSRESGV